MSKSEFAIFMRGHAAFVHPVKFASKGDWILYATPKRKNRRANRG